MTMANEEIVFFHYPGSPYANRITWYLKLAGVPYSECIQPPYLPRPDLAALDISYRRIPILCIGKHAYCDTRIILQVLQSKYPLKNQSPLSSADRGLERLLQHWTIDAGLFRRAAGLMPFENSPLASDPKFLADRTEMTGTPFDPKLMIAARPESLAHMRAGFDLLEQTLLADGRTWINGSKAPTVLDIEAVYLFRWLIYDLKAAGEGTEQMFPKTYAWIRRFNQAIKDATTAAPKPEKLSGDAAVKKILEASESPAPSSVDQHDPLGLKPGQLIEVWPLDTGFNHHDRGELVSLAIDHVTLRNQKGLLISFPRWNFRIRPLKKTAGAKVSKL